MTLSTTAANEVQDLPHARRGQGRNACPCEPGSQHVVKVVSHRRFAPVPGRPQRHIAATMARAIHEYVKARADDGRTSNTNGTMIARTARANVPPVTIISPAKAPIPATWLPLGLVESHSNGTSSTKATSDFTAPGKRSSENTSVRMLTKLTAYLLSLLLL